MGKFLNLFASAIPLIERILFPNGKFNKQRGIVIVVLFLACVLGIEFFGQDTVESAVDVLAPLVELLGNS